MGSREASGMHPDIPCLGHPVGQLVILLVVTAHKHLHNHSSRLTKRTQLGLLCLGKKLVLTGAACMRAYVIVSA